MMLTPYDILMKIMFDQRVDSSFFRLGIFDLNGLMRSLKWCLEIMIISWFWRRRLLLKFMLLRLRLLLLLQHLHGQFFFLLRIDKICNSNVVAPSFVLINTTKWTELDIWISFHNSSVRMLIYLIGLHMLHLKHMKSLHWVNSVWKCLHHLIKLLHHRWIYPLKISIVHHEIQIDLCKVLTMLILK